MVLVFIPSSPRNGSIIVAILTIAEFVLLITLLTFEDLGLNQTAFTCMVVVFSIICIVTSICLIFGAIQLNRKLIVPYILAMSLFVVSYAIVFIVMISGEHHQKDWIHFTILGGNICFLIAAGALYREILKAEQVQNIQVTISPNSPPIYVY